MKNLIIALACVISLPTFASSNLVSVDYSCSLKGETKTGSVATRNVMVVLNEQTVVSEASCFGFEKVKASLCFRFERDVYSQKYDLVTRTPKQLSAKSTSNFISLTSGPLAEGAVAIYEVKSGLFGKKSDVTCVFTNVNF